VRESGIADIHLVASASCRASLAVISASTLALSASSSCARLAPCSATIRAATMRPMIGDAWRPRKPRPSEDPNVIHWIDDPERIEKLYAYCKRDVETERELHRRLAPLIPIEQELYLFDQRVNDRGFYVDAKLLTGALRIADEAGNSIETELEAITSGAITSINQTAKLMAWLSSVWFEGGKIRMVSPGASCALNRFHSSGHCRRGSQACPGPVRKRSALSPGLPPRAADRGIETAAVERAFERLGLHDPRVQRRPGVDRIDVLGDALLVNVDDKVKAEALGRRVRETRPCPGISIRCRCAAAERRALRARCSSALESFPIE
jgi:hypothetical protein